MKRTSIVMVSLVALFFILYLIFKPGIAVHKRIGQISSDAVWVGGADGGVWYHITKELGDNAFRIKLYNEQTGEVWADTVFSLNKDCSYGKIDSLFIVKNINGYDGTKIFLGAPDHSKSCYLTPQ